MKLTDQDMLTEVVKRGVEKRKCCSCREIKPIEEFHKNGKRGRNYSCKECRNKTNRKWRKENIEKARAISRESFKNRSKERKRKVKKKYISRFPLREKAVAKVNHAIRTKQLLKPSACTICNKQRPVDGHHECYDHPFKIIWLCKPCHSKYHLGTTRAAETIRKKVRDIYATM